VEKILYYLPQLDKIRDRAECLHKQVLGEHTYQVRARRFIELIGKWNRAGQFAD
jgi:spore maturation protein CgeB